jgi:predicted metalloprotease with PDZ domain
MTEPIVHTLRFPDPAGHLAAVVTELATGGASEIELMMAVWTPGSYLVREFSRHLEGLTATGDDGGERLVTRTAKNRWRVACDGCARVRLRYRLYCHEPSVRTNFVDPEFALLNGAATFLTAVDDGAPAVCPHLVRVVPAAGWRRVISPLPAAPEGPGAEGEAVFLAADFDTLVDSPLYAGSGELRELTVDDVRYVLVDQGGDGFWDGDRAARDTAAVAAALHRFWGEVPYRRYVLFNLVTEGRGGLEHRDSTVLRTSRFKAGTRKGWLDWLGLVCHELFHAWNGKRLRPVELGPFDYQREVYTEQLWAVEGFTAYYDDLLVHRAGLSLAHEYLARLSENLEYLAATPGRHAMPLTAASFNAWIEHYRPDEHSVNRAVSYYRKGAVVAWLLDARIRGATGGRRSLDDVMQRAYRRWSGERGYTAEDLFSVVAEVADEATAGWLAEAVGTAGELDLSPALGGLGLELVEAPRTGDEPGRAPGPAGDEEPAAWLGAETACREGRLWVSAVHRGTPAAAAGLSAGDELLAIDGFRLPPDGLAERLAAYRPGRPATLLVARRKRLQELAVRFGAEPSRKWRLAVDPEAGPGPVAQRAAWLAGRRSP